MHGTRTGDAARKARAQGPALAVAAIGIAGLQAAQSLIGSFNPRVEVMAIAAVALIAATTFVQRLRTRDVEAREAGERGEQLAGSLRVWPIVTPEETIGADLGLYPARRGADAYVRRNIDEALRRAVAEERLVLVVGPRGAGKTRSAIEALRQAAPADAVLVVPRDGEALCNLLQLDPELRNLSDPSRHRIVWLDGAARFLKAIQPEALLQLVRNGDGAGRGPGDDSPPRVTVVATARDTAWQEALESDDDHSETAKALLGHALVVELPPDLEPDELRDAQTLHPNAHFEGGIGAAVGSPGEGWPGDPNDTGQPRADAGGDTSPLSVDGPAEARRDKSLIASAVIALLALGALAILALTDNFEKPSPPSIGEQAGAAARAGAMGTRDVVLRDRADFRGSGEASYVFAFADGSGTPEDQQRADEIQIWDQHAGKLKRAFSFEPAGEGVFQFRGIHDIDGDGADELVGGYGSRLVPGELLVPFALDLEEDTDSYRIVSLAPKPPLLRIAPRGEDARDLRAEYRRPLTLIDAREGTAVSLRGYRSQDFAVTPVPHRLISAYVTDIDPKRDRRVVEVWIATFGMTGGAPRLTPCTLSGTRTVTLEVPASTARLLHLELLERWAKFGERRDCVVQALSRAQTIG